MLDDAMSLCAMSAIGRGAFRATAEVKISFFRPVKPMPVTVYASHLHETGRMLFVEAILHGADGAVSAKGSAIYAITPPKA
jgi:acyl-coenzyme A thioesterase PaaI-like protein